MTKISDSPDGSPRPSGSPSERFHPTTPVGAGHEFCPRCATCGQHRHGGRCDVREPAAAGKDGGS